jgi:glycosyltransferase involved in cell wall biosynthesis
MPVRAWRMAAQVRREEQIGELDVHHPRYFLVPKVSMPFHGALMFLGCRQLVLRLHREMKFDCIDAHFVFPDGFAACLLGKMLNLPVIVSARGTDMTLYPRFQTIQPLIRWTLKKATGLIAVSESLKTAMLELGAPATKIRVISNGVDVARFSAEDRGAARQKLGLSGEGKIVVSVGALLPVKCHERLISALAALKQNRPALRAYVVGEGPSRSKLQGLITRARLSEHVFLVGSRPNEELKYWFSAADVSCLTSSREGWPNVVSESLACGTPVVATRVGGVPEVIPSLEFGIIVEPTVAAITAGLESALGRSWNREVLTAHARARTWDVVAREVQEFSRECAASSYGLEAKLPG